MSLILDYELRIPRDGVKHVLLAQQIGDVRIDYDRFSVSRLSLYSPQELAHAGVELYPFTEVTVYAQDSSGVRVPFARAWLTRKLYTPTGVMYEFSGARDILRLTAMQGIFLPTQTVQDAIQSILTKAQEQLQSNTFGINITDWQIGSGMDATVPVMALTSPVTGADIIEELERVLPGLLVVFAFDPEADSPFRVRAIRSPQHVITPDVRVTEWDERYERIFNSVIYLMESPAAPNVVPNPDFAEPELTIAGDGLTNLVPNPSFEVPNSQWTPPSGGIYYEWDSNYGYTGNRNFKFHDCHEYSANGWLTSAQFPVSLGVTYAGGFALGCDPLLAYECGGPSTVKVRVQILGYTSGGSLTETAYDAEISGIFHNSLHWHWVPIQPFSFTNSNTVFARIRFNTFHGKRLYLDEVRVHPAYSVTQRGWVLATDGATPPLVQGTHFTIDWMKPVGVSTGKHVQVGLSLPSSRWIELQSSSGELYATPTSYFLTIAVEGSLPTAYIDWYDEHGNLISTSNPSLIQNDYVTEETYTWGMYVTSALTAPANARFARVRLRWTGVTGQTSRIRCVYLGSRIQERPSRYGREVTSEVLADSFTFLTDIDAELAGEASDSSILYGVITALRVSDWVLDDYSAEQQALADFLQYAVAERVVQIEGAVLDDIRVLYPHLYRIRVPHPLARSLPVLSLQIQASGKWQARLGHVQPDMSALLRYVLRRLPTR